MSSAKVSKFCERDKKKLDEMVKKLATMSVKEKGEYDTLAAKYERECVKVAKGVTRGMGTGARAGGSRRIKKRSKLQSRRRR